jgi:hypothetical protein
MRIILSGTMTLLLTRRLFAVAILALAGTSTFAIVYDDGDEYANLLDCLTHGSSDCSLFHKDCVWCPAASTTSTTKSKPGLCVSRLASSSFGADSHYQCGSNRSDDDYSAENDDTTQGQDDYFPPSDDATFDDDQAVDDDTAAADDDDTAPIADDDTNNDDIDTDDYNPYVDDDQSGTDDQTDDDAANTDDGANTDDDSNSDDYMKKLLECLAVGMEKECAENSPTECVWCTTSFAEGLCVSTDAGKDIDGSFYTCKWKKEDKEDEVDSSVYDHYCWNAHNEAACEMEVDGRDVPCVWCPSAQEEGQGGMCFSQAQTDFVQACNPVEKEE